MLRWKSRYQYFRASGYYDLARSSAKVFLYRIVASIITLLLTLKVANLLGVEYSGHYFFVVSFLMLLASLSSLGLNNAILKRVSILSESSNSVSGVVYRSVILISISSVFLISMLQIYTRSGTFGLPIHDLIKAYDYVVCTILFPLTIIFLFSNYFHAYQDHFKMVFSTTLGYQTFLLIFLSITDTNSIKEVFYFLQASVFFVFLVILYWYSSRHKIRIRIDQTDSFRGLMTLAFPMLITAVLSQINSFSSGFLLSIYGTDSDLSIFGVALRLSIVMGFIFLAVIKVSTPKIARYHESGDMRLFETTVLQSNRILFFTSIPVFFAVLLLGDYLLGLFGDEFVAGYGVLIIITFGQTIASIFGISIFILQMTGHQNLLKNDSAIVVFVSVIIGWFLVSVFGLVGSAIAVALSLTISNVLATYRVYQVLGINPVKIF